LALRLPSTKKNYDTIVHNHKQFADMFRKHECYAPSFQLDSTVISEGFIVYPFSLGQPELRGLDGLRVLKRPKAHG
jgi:hypothetical protein